jgi:hypothetical protein
VKIGTGRPLPRLLALTLATLLPLSLVTAVSGAASAASCNTVATVDWSNNCDVSQGDSSNYVEAIEDILFQYSELRNYPTCYPDNQAGNFDAGITSAIECFQSHTGLTADGIVGPLTWGKMQSFLWEQNCDGNWCYSDFDGQTGTTLWRQWQPSGIWYYLGNHSWAQMNTGTAN